MGRKTRRAHCTFDHLNHLAPVLSRAVDVPPPLGVLPVPAAIRVSNRLLRVAHPGNSSNPARFSQRGGFRRPRRDFRPTAPSTMSTPRRIASTITRRQQDCCYSSITAATLLNRRQRHQVQKSRAHSGKLRPATWHRCCSARASSLLPTPFP